jgi:hypothetical protein
LLFSLLLRSTAACASMSGFAESLHRARSHRNIRKAAVDPFEDSQDMPRFKTGQPAEPFN